MRYSGQYVRSASFKFWKEHCLATPCHRSGFIQILHYWAGRDVDILWLGGWRRLVLFFLRMLRYGRLFIAVLPPDRSASRSEAIVQWKHKIYGYKTRIGVAQCCPAVYLSWRGHESVAGTEILRNNFTKLDMMLCQTNDEIAIEDNGPDISQNETRWATFNDSAYQGTNEQFRVTHLSWKQNCRRLSTHKSFNERVHGDKVTVEKFLAQKLVMSCRIYAVQLERKDI